MPHSGGYLPGAFSFKPLPRADAKTAVASTYGSIAASTTNNYSSGVTGGFALAGKGATTDIQIHIPSTATPASYEVTWSVENTDAGGAHDGGYYFRYWN